MAQLALGAVGAVAGFFLSSGNPYGALIGFNVGASLGASMSETIVQGNKIGDIAKQTSKEGVARPIVWGRVRPIGGNLIACSEPKVVKVKHKSGGKGGGGSTTTVTESVYRTYAIRVCEGPITKYVRIWRNNELVYDARGNDWGDENNAEFLKTARLYLGGWDQMPDSALEGIFGAGNVPPHRGTAYMVMDNELLDDTGGAVPQWTFEVERAEGIVLTSNLYPIENIESVYVDGVTDLIPPITDLNLISLSGPVINESSLTQTLFLHPINVGNESVSMSFDGIVYAVMTYTPTIINSHDQGVESLSFGGTNIVDCSLTDLLIDYEINPNDEIAISGPSIITGTLS